MNTGIDQSDSREKQQAIENVCNELHKMYRDRLAKSLTQKQYGRG